MELKQKQCQNWSPNLHEASVKVMQAIATRNISRPFRLDTGTAAYRSVPNNANDRFDYKKQTRSW